mgnify:CR=1 FL=1
MGYTERMKIYPLTLEDSQVHFIFTSLKYGLCSLKEAKRAIKKLRDKKIIEDNRYQATYVN